MEVCGIYGYEFTKSFWFRELEFIPRFTDTSEAHRASRSRAFELTGWVRCGVFGQVLPFRLAAILSFIERMKVVIADPVAETPSFKTSFLLNIPGGMFERSSGGGAVLLRDCFEPDSRPDFINKAMLAFEDTHTSENFRFPELIFSCVESFSLSRPLIELQYFLLFSAVECHARTVLSDSSSRLPRILAKALSEMGFDVSKENKADPRKSMKTYTDLRNALFHHGRRYFIEDGSKYHRLPDYLFNFAQLVALLIFKVVGFDDGHINWDSWLDRQAFK